MNRVVATFERSIDKLESQADRSEALNSSDLRTALSNAAAIDDFVYRHSLSTRARRDWARARYDYLLDTLLLKQAAGTLTDQDVALINGWLK